MNYRMGIDLLTSVLVKGGRCELRTGIHEYIVIGRTFRMNYCPSGHGAWNRHAIWYVVWLLMHFQGANNPSGTEDLFLASVINEMILSSVELSTAHLVFLSRSGKSQEEYKLGEQERPTLLSASDDIGCSFPGLLSAIRRPLAAVKSGLFYNSSIFSIPSNILDCMSSHASKRNSLKRYGESNIISKTGWSCDCLFIAGAVY